MARSIDKTKPMNKNTMLYKTVFLRAVISDGEDNAYLKLSSPHHAEPSMPSLKFIFLNDRIIPNIGR